MYKYAFYIHIYAEISSKHMHKKYAEICKNMDFLIDNMQKYAIKTCKNMQ